MYFCRGRNTLLVILYISAMEEIHFWLFYVFLPWKKDIFSLFMYFCHGRKTYLVRLCISAVEEIHKTGLRIRIRLIVNIYLSLRAL